MHRKRIKCLSALSLCAILASQNLMVIANAEELDKSIENEVITIQSDKFQLQENDLISEDAASDEINSDRESSIQVDPEENKTYSMGGKSARSATLDNLETVKLTNPNAIGCGTVTANELNVRSGSSTSYEKIGLLKLGETVDVIGKSNGWYKIDFKDKEGYISAAYLELKPIEKGIDVSKWNGNVDWKSVKNAGADYVIIRAGYGTSTVDEKFYQNIEGARDAGLKIGIYWFSYATSTEVAKKEANKCLQVISKYKDNITYPVFFDYEYASRDYAEKQGVTVTKELATKMANTFINTIKSAGYPTGLYTNKDFGNRYFSEDIINSNNLWVAQYANKNTYGRAYDMWQYTETGKIPGISGNFDLNYTCLKPEGVIIDTVVNDNNNNDTNNNNNDNKPSTTLEKGVVTENLNLREGASTSSKIITTIPKGETIEILDKSISGWYKVKYSEKIGYVSSKYVLTNTTPKIEVEDTSIKINSKFDPFSIVTAIDYEDGNITDKIEVIENTVDTKKTGEYKVVYKVTNSKGVSVIKDIKVTVLNVFSTFTVNNINKNTTSISGKGTSGATVKAYVNGKQIGKSAKVGTSGTYKITIPKQKAGTKVVVKISKSGYASSEKTITVLNVFSGYTVNNINKNSTSISGKGTSGATVKAYVDGKQIGKSAKVGKKGTYKITIPKQKAGKKVVVKISKSGYATSEKTIKVLNVFNVYTVNNINKNSTSISGKGINGATVKAYVNGKQIGKSAKVGTKGTYKITIPKQKSGKKVVVKISKSGYETKSKTITVKK